MSTEYPHTFIDFLFLKVLLQSSDLIELTDERVRGKRIKRREKSKAASPDRLVEDLIVSDTEVTTSPSNSIAINEYSDKPPDIPLIDPNEGFKIAEDYLNSLQVSSDPPVEQQLITTNTLSSSVKEIIVTSSPLPQVLPIPVVELPDPYTAGKISENNEEEIVREGLLESVKGDDGMEAIVSGAFRMEENIRNFIDTLRIVSPVVGELVGPFGKMGKCKVRFPDGYKGALIYIAVDISISILVIITTTSVMIYILLYLFPRSFGSYSKIRKEELIFLNSYYCILLNRKLLIIMLKYKIYKNRLLY